jgi:hypothetical protein
VRNARIRQLFAAAAATVEEVLRRHRSGCRSGGTFELLCTDRLAHVLMMRVPGQRDPVGGSVNLGPDELRSDPDG